MLYYKPLSLHLLFFQNLHLFQARQEVLHADHLAVVPGRKKFSGRMRQHLHLLWTAKCYFYSITTTEGPATNYAWLTCVVI